MKIDDIYGLMAKQKISKKEMAKELGMDPSTFYRKWKSPEGEAFTVKDLYGFKRVLKMDKQTAADFLLP